MLNQQTYSMLRQCVLAADNSVDTIVPVETKTNAEADSLPDTKNTKRREVDDHETPSPACWRRDLKKLDYLTKNYPRENGMA